MLKGFRKAADAFIESYIRKQEVIVWKPEHHGSISGQNGFGERFLIQYNCKFDQRSSGFTLVVYHQCPDGRPYCDCQWIRSQCQSIEEAKERAHRSSAIRNGKQ